VYRFLFTHVLAKLDPERAHHLGLGSVIRRWTAPRTDQSVEALGLRFETPFGVAAGFDKDGKGVLGLGLLGFGHVEVGTITAIPQAGNPKPRLFRLVPDRAVINRMGFNNEGAASAAPRLARTARVARRPVLGVNIGKSRVVDVADATADYVSSASLLAPTADYLVVNVSSPNTPGLRGLQELEQLSPLLDAVRAAAGTTPLLVKIAPDLTDAEVDRIAQLVVDLGLDGIIATNTTRRPVDRGPAAHPRRRPAGAVRDLRRRCRDRRGRPGTPRCRRHARSGLHGVPVPWSALGAADQPRSRPPRSRRPLTRSNAADDERPPV
jgi:dihydroorotate dehydrogenase